MRLGPYEVRREIARGGSAVVFEGEGPDGRAVAIKVVRTATAEQRARFERERRLLAALGEEQGFVPLLDAGDASGGAFFVMPLLRGGTLRELLKRPFSVDETVALGVKLARALELAHERGIVHRDLKPENVLFTEGGAPLVADLGLAKHFRDDTPGASQSVSVSIDGFRGTAGYMSPEQMHDARTVGPTSDVFALGAILYECLAGAPAFSAESIIGLVARVDDGAFLPLGRRRGDVPAWLEATIARALAHRKEERFRDAGELRRALSRREAPRARAARAVSLIALLLALLALGAAAALLALGRRAPPAPTRAPSVRIESPAAGEWLFSDELVFKARVEDGTADSADLAITVEDATGSVRSAERLAPGADGRFEVRARAASQEGACRLDVYVRQGPAVIASASVNVKLVAAPQRLPDGMRIVRRETLPGGRPLRVYGWRLPDRSIETPFVYVPPGLFLAGKERFQKTTGAYFIGRHETTRREFLAFCSATERAPPPDPPFLGELARPEEHPIVNVSYEEALEYVAWAGLRLPSSDEWERAARGADGRRFPWGDAWDPRGSNHGDASTPAQYVRDPERDDDGFPYTAPVGSFPRGVSPFGALDMAGNVWEWTAERVFHGGGWWQNRGGLESSLFFVLAAGQDRALDIGFRVALTAP